MATVNARRLIVGLVGLQLPRYLVTEELLVKAHERGETARGSATYSSGS